MVIAQNEVRGEMLLKPMVGRLHLQHDIQDTVDIILNDVIALQGAELGNIRILDSDGSLLIVANRGFKSGYVRRFCRISQNDKFVSARAVRSGRIEVVPDLERDEYFDASAEIWNLGVRSIVSSPLITNGNVFIGVVSAHFIKPHITSEMERSALLQYCREAATYLEEIIAESDLTTIGHQLNAQLLARSVPTYS